MSNQQIVFEFIYIYIIRAAVTLDYYSASLNVASCIFRDKFNWKLKGGVLFTIYLQTSGELNSENYSL